MVALLISMVALDPLIQRGDSLFAALKYEEALKEYQKAYGKDNNNYEILWRLSMAYLNIGEGLDNDNERKIYFKKALEFANKATEVNPEGDWGWTYVAAVNGRIALTKGGKEKVKYAMIIKDAVNKALKLNPNNDLANFIWGSYNFEAATLNPVLRSFAKTLFGEVPEGTIEDAEKYIKRAIELNPGRIQYYYELARIYEHQKKVEQAKAVLSKAVKLRPQTREDIKYREQARKMLEKLEKK
ncbi:MAG: tetratricopeptide repeat protein [bacterium]|nr:tetratricopeptide repeat protein [bacterium]